MGLMEQYGVDAEIDVRVPSRKLTEKEVEELNIRLNKNTGDFDYDALIGDFNVDDLLDWGFKPHELGIEGEDVDYDEIWQGMPEFEQEKDPAFRSITVHFENEEDISNFSELIGQMITPKTKYIWHPKLKKEKLINQRYIDES